MKGLESTFFVFPAAEDIFAPDFFTPRLTVASALVTALAVFFPTDSIPLAVDDAAELIPLVAEHAAELAAEATIEIPPVTVFAVADMPLPAQPAAVDVTVATPHTALFDACVIVFPVEDAPDTILLVVSETHSRVERRICFFSLAGPDVSRHSSVFPLADDL